MAKRYSHLSTILWCFGLISEINQAFVQNPSPTEDATREFVENLVWSDCPHCPHCGKAGVFRWN
ncbi:transposase [Agrobacterium sp.]|uniref:transposase n=1 Tax=Agrobacterium sp. TaxID=361 RepID=UPI00391BB58C